jgi:uncharacterized protein (TIGR02300 family)
MPKPEWGTKRTGPCGTKFYDFNKSPIICPGCGGEVITHEVKTNKNKNEVDKNLKSNSKEQSLIEDDSKNTDLDSGILDDDVINDDVSLNEALESEHENNISDDEDINLISDDNNIVLDVEIEGDEK